MNYQLKRVRKVIFLSLLGPAGCFNPPAYLMERKDSTIEAITTITADSESKKKPPYFKLLEKYLAIPEYILPEKSYETLTKAYNCQNILPFQYSKAVIPYNEYVKLLDNFNKTYISQKLPTTPNIQKIIVPQGAEIRFIGDLHGSVHGLIRVLVTLMKEGFLDSNLKIIKPHGYLIFLGDLVDYGRF